MTEAGAPTLYDRVRRVLGTRVQGDASQAAVADALDAMLDDITGRCVKIERFPILEGSIHPLPGAATEHRIYCTACCETWIGAGEAPTRAHPLNESDGVPSPCPLAGRKLP